ncbi:MAG: oxidoreductase, partial [Comamonadaceae bacterium]
MKNDLQWSEAQVVALRDVTPTVREFELQPAAGHATPHEPGAHVQVQVLTEKGKVQTRSYSLVGEPDGRFTAMRQ